MKTKVIFYGFIALAIITLAGCDTTTNGDPGIRVYNIPVTGEVTQARVDTIKAAIDDMGTWGIGYITHMNYIKNNIKEFRIEGSGMTIELDGGKPVAKIGIDVLEGVNPVDFISGKFYDYAVANGIAFLQMKSGIRIVMNTDKIKVNT